MRINLIQNKKWLAVLGICALPVWGDPPAVNPQAIVQEITTQLASAEADVHKTAIASITKLLETDPSRALNGLRQPWLKSLMDAKQFEEADALALKAILLTSQLAAAAEPGTVEAYQSVRVRALLGAGKSEKALGCAKSLFNISSMPTTKDAMLLVAECLNAAHPGDGSFTDRFRTQQINGAVYPAPTTKPIVHVGTGSANDGTPVLAAIKVDAADYQDTLAKLFGEDFNSLTARGNLLLLADKPKEAQVVFERAYGVATEGQVVTATESLARSMKAEDGTIGRANSWIMSLRPAGKTGKGG